MVYKGHIIVKLKDSIKDVRAITIEEAVKSSLGDDVKIRAGAFYEFSLSAKTKKEAETKINQVAEELLCNPITEVSEIVWEE